MRVLYPTDFSEAAEHAEGWATELVRALGGELIVLHVSVERALYGEGASAVDVRKVYEAQHAWAQERLEERAAALRKAGVPARWLLRVGVPFDEIVTVAADEGADVIVMGTHGRSGLNRLLLGSVTERVVRLAPCPVLTVREAAKGKPAPAEAGKGTP